MQVRHLNGKQTDNRAENLRWGTPQENYDDRNMHGNQMRGERNGNSRLTSADVREIRRQIATGRLLRDISVEFGVTGALISKIKRNQVWAHLPVEESVDA
jgi:hypothetical protein